MSYLDVFIGDLRLKMLRVLEQAPAYSANSHILHAAVEELGVSASRDQVRSELAWLEEQRLITLLTISTTLNVATITERGADVAKGRSTVPGVPRPTPGA